LVRIELWSYVNLDFFGGGWDGGFGSLEADLGMHAVAEGLLGGSAAAAKRDGRFTGQIPFCAVCVYKLDGSLDAKWSVRSNSDLYFAFSHAGLRVKG
jgi:hypothetical protein